MTGTNDSVSDIIKWRWSQKKRGRKEEEEERTFLRVEKRVDCETHLCKRSVGQRLEEFKGGDA
tara:strand:+ start:198 stop:386 length:189 start_codon:yes stop_codon:yes gene_type:complete